MADESALDCPVCGEQFDTPKLLECNHLICRKCIVDWLRKAGPSGGCPLCRAPILPPCSHQDDLEALVDALPTDLTIVAKVESDRMLSSRHICMYCDNNIVATSFCLQCNMKLCNACAKGHKKFPPMKSHVVEVLNKLTSERLAEVNRSTCKGHDDRMAEIYCCSHQELICMLCATTDHRLCTEAKAIKEAATEKREEFRLKAQRLREKEMAMRTQIKKAKDNFTAMRAKANAIFDNLQQSVERRRQEVNDLIQAEEDKMDLPQLDQDRAANMSQAGVLDNLVESAPDDALLDMGRAMTSRLHDLEQQSENADRMKDLPDIIFDSQKLTKLKSDISTFGQLGWQAPTPPGVTSTATGPKPRRAELAKVLKVGDRVRRGPDWPSHYGNQDGGGPGTVTAVPSQILSSVGGDPTGTVDVVWDSGGERCYWMGRHGPFHLDLV